MAIKRLLYRHTYARKKRARVDLTLSENPLGASLKAIAAISLAAPQVHLYPEEGAELIKVIAKHHNVAENAIFLGAGANQLLEDILKIYALGKSIVVPTATFPESVACIATLKGSVDRVPLNSDLTVNLDAMFGAIKADTAFIHLCNPNNPTGIWTDIKKLLLIADRSPIPLLISEAGADFVGQTIVDQPIHPNIIVVRSLSKAYGLAGLRIGYVVAPSKIITSMKLNLGSYRTSSLAIAAAIAAIQDQEHLQHSIAYVLNEKTWLMQEMNSLGFKVIPSQGQNFIAQVPPPFGTAQFFCKVARKHGIAVLNCSLYEGLEQYIRITPQKQDVNKKYILILKKIMEENYEYSTHNKI